jgi:hypothetical protein
MIAEVLLPKANAESGKEITDMYDEEKQGESEDRRRLEPIVEKTRWHVANSRAGRIHEERG